MRRLVPILGSVLVAVSCSGPVADQASTTSSSIASSTTSSSIAPATTTTTVAGGKSDGCPLVDAGLGDTLFAGLGNVGYEVELYEITLEFEIPDEVTEQRTFSGTTTVRANATTSLVAFNLDTAGLDVSAVSVNGAPAMFCPSETELTVVPPRPIGSGAPFDVEVAYSGVVRPRTDLDGFSAGLIRSGTGLYAIDQPNGASSWFPANDHPTDRARFRLTLSVPSGLEVVSAGDLVSVDEESSMSTYTWETREPMIPYLLPMAIGRFEEEEAVGADGLQYHYFFEEGATESSTSSFAQMPRILEHFEAHFGDYPFDLAGAIVTASGHGAALETQTIHTYSSFILDQAFNGPTAVIAHETAHQWFGDWVAVADWSDIWLNEGFATWSEYLWLEELRGVEEADSRIEFDYRSWVDAVESRGFSPPGIVPGPGALFNPSVYVWGGLTLVALRDDVGDEIFFDILQTWVARFGGSNARTSDFLALVEEKASVEARELVELWIFSETVPALTSRGLSPDG